MTEIVSFRPCDRCRIAYPEGYVAGFFSGTSNEQLCGVCALDRMNEIHRKRMTKFYGTQAEGKRQMALAYRAMLAVQAAGLGRPES